MHFTTMVIGEDPEDQLAPFDESRECDCDYHDEEGEFLGHEPDCDYDGRWDWYQIGGRWSGFLRLKPEHTTGRLRELSWTWNNVPIEERPSIEGLQADQARLRDIDFEYMRLKESILALARYETYEEIVFRLGFPPACPDGPDPQGQWEQYHSHPTVQALRQAGLFPKQFQERSKEQYVKKYEDTATLCHATLYQGQWLDSGWGETSQDYIDSVTAILSSLDPDTLITIVDCHT